MNIKELNKISIKEYLTNKGINPVKDRGYYGMYHSPFREDGNASMKVDYNKNLWIDFGSNEGGTMIDLVMRINNCSLTQAINKLKQYNSTSVNQDDNTTVQQANPFSFHGNSNQSAITILKVLPINHQALTDYLAERKVDIETAKQHCKEIHYSVNGKAYFAVGFQNDSGGWVLRSNLFKGCNSNDITFIKRNSDTCLVFEGFTDYLSYLTLRNIRETKQDVIILNSVSNLSKAIELLKGYKEIYTYLDNDDPGKKASEQIKATCTSGIVKDQSVHYADHKDLNDYLIASQQIEKEKQPIQRKPSKGLRM